jgi:hypothetical protein
MVLHRNKDPHRGARSHVGPAWAMAGGETPGREVADRLSILVGRQYARVRYSQRTSACVGVEASSFKGDFEGAQLPFLESGGGSGNCDGHAWGFLVQDQ